MVWFWESGSCPLFCSFQYLQLLLNELFAQILVINTGSSPNPFSTKANLSWVLGWLSRCQKSEVVSAELGCCKFFHCPFHAKDTSTASLWGRSWNIFRNFLWTSDGRTVLRAQVWLMLYLQIYSRKNRWLGVLTLVGRCPHHGESTEIVGDGN